MMRVISFKADEILAGLLEREARLQGVSKSEIIRRALRKYLLENGEERRVIATRKVRIIL